MKRGGVVKSILGIVGSPRREGNTHSLVSAVLAGAESRGASTETILLGSLMIKECDGCHACWNGGGCVKKDDMRLLYPKINQADVLVLGTPVYWYGPTALMKGFMDRFVYYNCDAHRPEIRGKKAVLTIPFEEENENTAALVVDFFQRSLQFLQMPLLGQIIAGGMLQKGQAKKDKELMVKAFTLGQRLVTEK
jgi:multimeric flavodoxin WrbA